MYMDPDRAGLELAAATPFECSPVAGCPLAEGARPSRGGLLLHGLSDMPFAMRDLADAFAERCFFVRAMLLPGHGTRAGDLLDVTREDWVAATRFGLKTLKEDVDQVFVGGFSLGGLLTMHAVLEDATVQGAFLFSPALALRRAWLVRQSVWPRRVLDWLDWDSPDAYARNEAMPVNATAETFLLSRELARLLERRHVTVAVFMAMNADDPVIDVAVNRSYFEHSFCHPGSQLVVYRRDLQEGIDPGDARVSYRNSFLPEQRIAGFSHQAIHIAPANTRYGTHGDYRSCGQASDESAEAVARCLAAPHPWRGEVVGRQPGGNPQRIACGAADLQHALRRTARTGRRVPHGEFVLNRRRSRKKSENRRSSRRVGEVGLTLRSWREREPVARIARLNGATARNASAENIHQVIGPWP